MSATHRLIPMTILAAAIALGGPAGVEMSWAADFRIDSWVLAANKRDPDARGTTIFHGGLVYDYLEPPAEVIVFDPSAGRFVLLDTVHQVRTELSTEEVAAFSGRIKQWAAKHHDPFFRWLSEPSFEEKGAANGDTLTLSGPWMTYQAKLTTAGGEAAARQYREFSDWYARLNAVLSPGSRPPFARLALNEAVARRQAVPQEVALTLSPKNGSAAKPTTVRSRHELVLELTKADTDRVAQTRQWMESFRPVGFNEYRQAAGR